MIYMIIEENIKRK